MDIIQCNLLVKTKRKWKSRWVVLRRVDPGSDRINLYIYKDRLSAIGKQREKFLLSLRDFCSTECVDKDNRLPKMVIITETRALSLRFENKKDRDNWDDIIVSEGGFGQAVTYDGLLPSRQPLKSGEVSLHIYPNFFTLIRKQNFRCIGRWKFEQLFNYGPVDGGFVFRVENELEGSAEPESFLLVTSSEKQINRTFDTVYKTAHHMYGSADGLQRPTKVVSPRALRPRSMSEPSGFKRFMQRLSIRRKSRRPKSPKWKDDSGHHHVIESNHAKDSQGSFQHAVNNDEVDSKNHLDPESPDERKSVGSAGSSSPGISPSPSDGVLSCQDGVSPQDDKTSNGCDHARVNGEFRVSAEESIGDEKDGPNPGDRPVNGEDLSVWQRRSALFLNTDDMVREGFMKTKQTERRLGDPTENEVNSDAGGLEAMSYEAAGIQARRNTSGSRGKRPMLTIRITPSGSEPSLNQYVNVPERPRNKQVTRLHPGEWDRYDSEENVYHHLDKVIGQPGYQNVPGSMDNNLGSKSLNSSYQNVDGRLPDARSYENVGVAPNMHYINVEAKPQNSSVNYIKVSGSGPPTPVHKTRLFNSRKANPDYSEIDLLKTKQLGEMSREARKERVERAKKN